MTAGQVNFYAQHTAADPTRRSYSVGDQAMRTVLEMVQRAGTVAVDIETAGLDSLAFTVKVIIIATATHACVLDAGDARHRDAAREAMSAAKKLVFHNCFTGDTEFLTDAGLRSLKEMSGQSVRVWSGDRWSEATIEHFGAAPVSRVEVGWTKSRCRLRETYECTGNHRWILRDGSVRTTDELRPGDVLEAAVPDVPIDTASEAFVHGLVFADGTHTRIRQRDNKHSHQIRLCGWKARYSTLFPRVTYPETYNGDPMCYVHSATNYKELPTTEDPDYLASFIAGWLALDGDRYLTRGKTTTGLGVASARSTDLDWLQRYGPSAGWLVVGRNELIHGSASFNPGTPYFRATVTRSAAGRHWTVKNIDHDTHVEDVYCPLVPGVARFTLASGLLTMNSAYDVPPLVAAGIMDIKDIDRIVDTLVYARMALTGERDGRRLADLEKRFLSASLRSATKDNLAEWGKINKLKKSEIFSRAHYSDPVYQMYAGWDGILTAMLLPHVREAAHHQLTFHPFGRYGADAEQAGYLLRREQKMNRVMLRRSAAGIRVDDSRIAREQERLRLAMNERTDVLAGFGIEDPSNRNQLANVLQELDAFPPDHPRTATGKLSTAKANLEAIDHPAVVAFRSFDEDRRLFGYLEHARVVAHMTGGRIHPQVNIMFARTGRTSYSNPALQQFTAPAREALLADESDSLVSIDWSSIEPVLAANMAHDMTLIEKFEAGEKLYNVVSDTAGVAYSDAKVIVLALLYGQGVRSLAAAHGWELDHAKQLQARVASAMPRTERFVRWAAVWSANVGKTWTLSGRIIDVDKDFGYKGSNFVVQGSAYDVLSESISAISEAGLADGVYISMHDELVVSGEIAGDVAKIMTTPPERLCELAGRTPVLRVEAKKLGRRWGDAHDVLPAASPDVASQMAGASA